MIYFANFQQIYFMSDLLLAQPNQMSHVFYTCAVPHHGNCEGWWSDPFHGSHLRVWLWVVLSPRVLYVSIPHVENARQGYTPSKWRMSEVGRCPCSGLTHGYRFYSERYWLWTLSWVLAWNVRCVLWSSAGTLTSFSKSLSEQRLVLD
jgi:hypothetical protein